MSFGSAGRLVLLGAGTLLLVDLLLGWQEVCVRVGAAQRVCGTRSGWAGFGIAVGLATTALVVWVAIELTGFSLPRRGAGVLAATVSALAAIEFVRHGEKRSWPAWAGLALAVAIVAGGTLTLYDPGRSRR
jgi:hypothetical protein